MATKPRARAKPKGRKKKRQVTPGLTRNRARTGPRIPPEQRSKAIAFRLPPDVIDMTDAAASARHLSRNKLVELTLRDGLADFARKKEEADGQPDLFA